MCENIRYCLPDFPPGQSGSGSETCFSIDRKDKHSDWPRRREETHGGGHLNDEKETQGNRGSPSPRGKPASQRRVSARVVPARPTN